MAEAIIKSRTVDFQKVFGKYLGKLVYLALNKDQTEVIAVGKTPLQAIEKAHELHCLDPVIMLAPPKDVWGYIL